MSRTKVTLEVAADEIAAELGPDFDFQSSHAKNRVELDGSRVGLTFFSNFVARLGTILALAVVDTAYAFVGTELTLIWGSHPGPDGRCGARSFPQPALPGSPDALQRIRPSCLPVQRLTAIRRMGTWLATNKTLGRGRHSTRGRPRPDCGVATEH